MKKSVCMMMATSMLLLPYITQASPAGDSVIITEVMYDPATTGVDNKYEWFELYNPTNSTIDISGWRVEEEQTQPSPQYYVFASGTVIAPGQTLLVVNDTASFNIEFPGIVPDIDMDGTGCYSSTACLRFNNGSSATHVDYLKLSNSSGVEQDYVGWGDYAHAGAGETVCRITTTDTDTSVDWETCTTPTPGSTTFNTSPTSIILSGNTVDENSGTGALVGYLTSIDANTGDTHTYTFVTGSGDGDNTLFTLSGAAILINLNPDYESLSDYSIRVQSDDGHGGLYEQIITIVINDVNEPPVAVDDVFTGSENTTLIASTLPLVPAANDYDPDMSGYIASGGIVMSPTHGSVMLTGMGFDYIPEMDFCGTDTLTYQLEDDGGLLSNIATVTLVIICDEEPETPSSTHDGSSQGRSIFETINNNTQDTIADDMSGGSDEDTDTCDGSELEQAYCYAQRHNINTIDDDKDLTHNIALRRKDLAKMMVNFAHHSLGKEKVQNTSCLFDDIDNVNQEVKDYIIRACSMHIMGLESDGYTPLQSFMPEQIVTRAEFATVLSRTLYGDRYDQGYIGASNRYDGHLQKLFDTGYMQLIGGDRPYYSEQRNYVWLVLYRVSQDKE